jgi:hypothetical protein
MMFEREIITQKRRLPDIKNPFTADEGELGSFG